MSVAFSGSTISFDLHDILCQMSFTAKQELIESLSADDMVIKFVTQQIVDGFTDNGYRGSQACTANADVFYGLDWAIREVSKASGDIAKKEIERLEDALRKANATIQEQNSRDAAMRRGDYW